jgi:L-threonylcarbamoyladenylate synthase
LGIESTVVGFDGDRPMLLRPGAVPREEIEDLIGPLGAPGNLIQSPLVSWPAIMRHGPPCA